MSEQDAAARHRRALEALELAILDGPGVLPPDVRRAAARGEAPDPFAVYADTIHRHAYRVSDRMVAGLAEAGAGQDEVFEISVAAAHGAARYRLEAGLRALRQTRGGA